MVSVVSVVSVVVAITGRHGQISTVFQMTVTIAIVGIVIPGANKDPQQHEDQDSPAHIITIKIVKVQFVGHLLFKAGKRRFIFLSLSGQNLLTTFAI